MENEDLANTRSQLAKYLSGNHAHVGFSRAVEGLSIDEVGIAPEGVPHTIWELVEHIRISQQDIVEFSRNPDYVSPEWPEGYWPASRKPSGRGEWEESVAAVERDHRTMIEMIGDPHNELLKPFEHGSGQTLLREALLIIDHNAYHVGQIVLIRRMLGKW